MSGEALPLANTLLVTSETRSQVFSDIMAIAASVLKGVCTQRLATTFAELSFTCGILKTIGQIFYSLNVATFN